MYIVVVRISLLHEESTILHEDAPTLGPLATCLVSRNIIINDLVTRGLESALALLQVRMRNTDGGYRA